MSDTDLTLSRVLRAPRRSVWRCWTQAEHLRHWFAPHPVTVPLAEVDPRPGGVFRTVMRMPDGQEMDSTGVILEAVPDTRLVFTDVLLPGWRPAPEPFFTAIITMEDHEEGTLYTATALHRNAADRARHEEMGFLDGWGTVAEQLGAHAASLTEGAWT